MTEKSVTLAAPYVHATNIEFVPTQVGFAEGHIKAYN